MQRMDTQIQRRLGKGRTVQCSEEHMRRKGSGSEGVSVSDGWREQTAHGSVSATMLPNEGQWACKGQA